MKRKDGQQKSRRRGRQATSENLAAVTQYLDAGEARRDRLIEYLHRIQDDRGYLDSGILTALAETLKLSTGEVYEVASFYHHFDLVKEGETPPPPLTIRVCDSISCNMAGAESLIQELQAGLGNRVRIQRVPCVGRCEVAPVAVVNTQPIAPATPDQVQQAIDRGATEEAIPVQAISYSAYLESGGYGQLKDLVNNGDETTYEKIIQTLENAKLRGLGGAGFPTGSKWRIVRGYPAPRMLAVNIDEGEPGTFKDRYHLENNPHRFLEGTLIAATVVGTDKVYIYLRDEYAGIRKLLQRELRALTRNPPCPLPEIELRRGAGAYICGEESAMIESIEGKRGIPRLRPPYIAEKGLFGLPTLEHNMETLYWVTELLKKGPDWFIDQGRNGRYGLRSFSVSGRVNRPGMHLAPAGITLNELIEEYCGGMLAGHKLKAYFPGGASGGILPASLADIPLDFDTLHEYGCFIGSAAIIVLSDQDSVREQALNAMRFFADESCGQCTPCRVGTEKASMLMREPVWNQPLLEELCQVMSDASICGLGQAAPNPLRCALKYFPEEFA